MNGIGALVERERRHLRRMELLAAMLGAAGAVALVLGVSAVILGGARWLALPRALPFAAWLVIGALLIGVAHVTRARLRRRATRAEVAHAIEREQGMRRGAIVGALEVEGQGGLAAHAARSVRGALPDGAPLAPALRSESTRRAVAGIGVAAAGVLVLASASPLFGDGLRAVLRPIDAWRGALLDRPRIEGAPRDLLRGSLLSVRVYAPGRTRVVLTTRETGERWRADTLLVDSRTGSAPWTLSSLRGDLRLVASDGRAESDSVLVRAA